MRHFQTGTILRKFSAMMNQLASVLCFFLACMNIQLSCTAQVASSAGNVKSPPPPLPLTTQIKKTIVFLSTTCLHDFASDTASIKQNLPQLSVQQQLVTAQQLVLLTLRLQHVPQSLAKLNRDEIEHLRSNFVPNIGDPLGLSREIVWRADVLMKMSSLNAQDIASLTPESLPILPVDEHLGTGFIVQLLDERIAPSPVQGQSIGFNYLIGGFNNEAQRVG
jgi:hypothetical protein